MPLVSLLVFQLPTGLGNANLTLLFAGLKHDPEGFEPGLPISNEGLHPVEFVQFGQGLLERLRCQHFRHAEIGRLHAQSPIGIRENPIAITAEIQLRHQALFTESIPDSIELPDPGLVMIGCLLKSGQCTLRPVHLL